MYVILVIAFVRTLTEAVHDLQKDQEKSAKDATAKDKQDNDLLMQNAELSEGIGELHQVASVAHWSNFPKPPDAAIIGSSVIRDIDQTK